MDHVKIVLVLILQSPDLIGIVEIIGVTTFAVWAIC